MISIQYKQISKITIMRGQRNVRTASAYSYQPSRSPNRLARELIDGAHEYARQESVLIQRTQSYLNNRFNYYHDSRCHSRGNTRYREASRARSNMTHVEPNRQVKEDCYISKKRAFQEERGESAESLQTMEARRNRAGQSKQERQDKKIQDLASKKSAIKEEERQYNGTGNRSNQPKDRRQEEKSQVFKYEVVKPSRKQEQKQEEDNRTRFFEEFVLQEIREMKLKSQQTDKKVQRLQNWDSNRQQQKKQVNLIPKKRPEFKEKEKKSSDAKQEENQECQKQRNFQDHYNRSPTQFQRYLNNRTEEEEIEEIDYVEDKMTSLNMSFGASQSEQEVKEHHIRKSQLYHNSEINDDDYKTLETVYNSLLRQKNRRIHAQKNLQALKYESARRQLYLQRQQMILTQQRQKQLSQMQQYQLYYNARKIQSHAKPSSLREKQKERPQHPKKHRDELFREE